MIKILREETIEKLREDEKVKELVKILKEKSFGISPLNLISSKRKYSELYTYFVKEYVHTTDKIKKLLSGKEIKKLTKEEFLNISKTSSELVEPILIEAGFL